MPVLKEDYGDGFYHIQTGTIGINLTELWSRCDNDLEFIDEFTIHYTHEFCHGLIISILREMGVYSVNKRGFEKVVMALAGQEFDNYDWERAEIIGGDDNEVSFNKTRKKVR